MIRRTFLKLLGLAPAAPNLAAEAVTKPSMTELCDLMLKAANGLDEIRNPPVAARAVPTIDATVFRWNVSTYWARELNPHLSPERFKEIFGFEKYAK